MEIKTKLDSIKKIKELKLNKFPEQLFKREEEEKIKKFIKDYPAEYYAVRSKEVVGCKKNNFKALRCDVLDEIKNFNLFTINVSSYNYTSNLILIGDIKIGKDNTVWFIGTTNKDFTGKMAEQFPEFNICTDIFDESLDLIPGFDLIYKYIVEHNLVDVIVEFAIYDKKVGIYNEKIIIFEIRTEF